jgi:hypothetical protein
VFQSMKAPNRHRSRWKESATLRVPRPSKSA